MVTFRKTEALAACFFDFFRDVRSRLIDFEVRREVASSQVPRIVIRSAFLELVTAAADATDAADAADAAEVVQDPRLGPPLPRAPGARMTVVKQIPSN